MITDSHVRDIMHNTMIYRACNISIRFVVDMNLVETLVFIDIQPVDWLLVAGNNKIYSSSTT
jgi:hypothetical protein